MIEYTYVTEKVEDGRRVDGWLVEPDNATGLQTLHDVIGYICREVKRIDMTEGDITEIKATRDKDGSILVAVTGNKDRIFSKVRRIDDG